MAALTFQQFSQWLAAYGKASQENNPQASADLFSPDAVYYETPFAEPLRRRDAIYHYWAKAAQTLVDKESSYEILAVQEQRGVARWQAQFTSLETAQRFHLDCIFLVEFDEQSLCRTFREWWHIHNIEQ